MKRKHRLVGKGAHPLRGREVRICWDSDEGQADYLVLGVAGTLMKLQPLDPGRPEAAPLWRSELDVRGVWELADIGRAPGEGVVPVGGAGGGDDPEPAVTKAITYRGDFSPESLYEPGDTVAIMGVFYRCRRECSRAWPPGDCWERVPPSVSAMLAQAIGAAQAIGVGR